MNTILFLFFLMSLSGNQLLLCVASVVKYVVVVVAGKDQSGVLIGA